MFKSKGSGWVFGLSQEFWGGFIGVPEWYLVVVECV